MINYEIAINHTDKVVVAANEMSLIDGVLTFRSAGNLEAIFARESWLYVRRVVSDKYADATTTLS